MQIIIKFLFLQFFNRFNIQIFQHGIEVEVSFDFLFMRHGIDHEVKIIEGEIFSKICVFLEDEDHPIQCKDGLEDSEVLGEEEEALDVEFGWFDDIELGVFLGRLDVCSCVVIVDVGETAFYVCYFQHHRFLDLRTGGVTLRWDIIRGIGHWHHELLVIIVEYFSLFLLLTFP